MPPVARAPVEPVQEPTPPADKKAKARPATTTAARDVSPRSLFFVILNRDMLLLAMVLGSTDPVPRPCRAVSGSPRLRSTLYPLARSSGDGSTLAQVKPRRNGPLVPIAVETSQRRRGGSRAWA